jgi:hypothetical protein
MHFEGIQKSEAQEWQGNRIKSCQQLVQHDFRYLVQHDFRYLWL